MNRAEANNDPRIILVGLNKTATRSFHDLFVGSGIASIHWRDEADRSLALGMVSNLSLGRAPFAGFSATAFSDMSHVSRQVVIEGARAFRAIHAAYRDAYFILNTRPVDQWIESRLAHAGGSYLRRSMAATGLDRDALIDHWRKLHATHEAELRAHFAGHPRFMAFDISRDDPQAIADFLAPEFAIDLAHWGHANARFPERVAS